MSDANAPLTAEEVLALLTKMAGTDPIIVGGQSVNLWAMHYAGRDPVLNDASTFVSKDIDLFANIRAARQLAAGLEDGRLILPAADDVTPNAALVMGKLGDRKVEVDFMASVLGVEPTSIERDFMTIAGRTPTGERLQILVMHPFDCVRSRLANVNRLKRQGALSIRQAEASVAVARTFVGDRIASGDRQYAQRLLQRFEWTIKNAHLGKDSHVLFGTRINPTSILSAFADDARLDERWRTGILKPALDRIAVKTEKALMKAKAKKVAQGLGKAD